VTSPGQQSSDPAPIRPDTSGHEPIAVGCVVLAVLLAVGLVYGGAATHDLLSYDDDRYVYANPDVVGGLTGAGVASAFVAPRFGAWHPLTTISHQLVWELSGDEPAAHHRVNVALHAANCLLVLFVFLRLTRNLWWSAAIALLFAVHPLHVESVAWVTERKDVLSGFFGLLCLLAYLRYVEQPTWRRNLLVIGTFCLGLLSKSMLVTLPFVFLLLDFWPLGRTRHWHPSPPASGPPQASEGTRSLWQLVVEKWPLFCLSLATSVTTARIHATAAGIENPTEIPWIWRLVNAPLAYVSYLGKAIWPVDLACFYPHPGLVSPGQLARYAAGALAAALLIVAVGALALALRQSRPWLLVGWLWYLGTLVPVIGFVQVGHAAMADRFFYLPSLGIYLLITAALRELSLRISASRFLVAPVALVLLLLAGTLARRQVDVWRSDQSLFEHALAVTSRNALAHSTLGIALGKAGELATAEREFRSAIAIDPSHHDYHYNLGFALESQAKLQLAAAAYARAVDLAPDDFDSHFHLGATYGRLGDYGLAAQHYQRAVELRPSHLEARRFLQQAERLRGQ